MGRFLVDDLLPARSLAILAGDSGLGKSALAYQLAMCIAAGHDFLDRRVRQGRVVILDYENGLQQMMQLCRSLRDHLSLPRVPEDFRLWSYNDSELGDEGQKEIRRLVTRERPALVVIDSLTGYAPDVEEKTANAIRCLQELRQLMKTIDCSVLAIHHLRKPTNDHTPAPLGTGRMREWFHRVRGAGALINATDVRLGVDVPSAASSEDAALVFGGFLRVRGEIPPLMLSRDQDGRGEPLGYSLLTREDLLPKFQRKKYKLLPKEFTFKQGKNIYAKGDQATHDFLQKCMTLGILRQEKRRGVYRKI